MKKNDGRRDDAVPRTLHDSFFKDVFSDPVLAADELRAVLPPALAARIDWPTLVPTPAGFVSRVFRQRWGDLVFHSQVRGGEALLWLVEHQSTEDWWMLQRVIDTKSLMWRRWRKLHPDARHLPVILPVVVYHGARPWRAPRDMHALYGLPDDLRDELGAYALSCTMIVDDLCAIDDETLRGRRMDAYAKFSLFAMAHAADEDFLDRVQNWGAELRRVFGDGDSERITTLLGYTYSVHRHTDPETVHQRIAAVVGPEHEDVMLSVADQLIERGIEKGIERGQRTMLMRQLGQRFGAVPAQIAARVEAASPAELERWSDRILAAATLDDIFDGE